MNGTPRIVSRTDHGCEGVGVDQVTAGTVDQNSSAAVGSRCDHRERAAGWTDDVLGAEVVLVDGLAAHVDHGHEFVVGDDQGRVDDGRSDR